MSDRKAASEVLGGLSSDDDGEDGRAVEAEPDATAEAESEAESSTKTESEPSGLRRWFRTDRGIDLNERTPFWDPEEGGIDRIGAAIKQAGGWEFMPPAFWAAVGVAEAAKTWIEASFLGGSDDGEDGHDQGAPRGRDPAAGGGQT